ncbi:hypothetical protein [Roseovarius ramblicola]|uniref:Uncharacterized protein n=1 Tax=Roseovarius ramblicola TaxID=2022336 RepID=A0ABV5HVE1_9RHOB
MTLATVLRLNAASCLGFGMLFLAMPGVVAAALGTPPAWLIAVLGAGLIGNAALLWLSVRGGRVPRRAEVLFFSIGDAIWVAATLALILSGVWIVTPGGRVAALAVAVMVGALGFAQRRRLPNPDGTARSSL